MTTGGVMGVSFDAKWEDHAFSLTGMRARMAMDASMAFMLPEIDSVLARMAFLSGMVFSETGMGNPAFQMARDSLRSGSVDLTTAAERMLDLPPAGREMAVDAMATMVAIQAERFDTLMVSVAESGVAEIRALSRKAKWDAVSDVGGVFPESPDEKFVVAMERAGEMGRAANFRTETSEGLAILREQGEASSMRDIPVAVEGGSLPARVGEGVADGGGGGTGGLVTVISAILVVFMILVGVAFTWDAVVAEKTMAADVAEAVSDRPVTSSRHVGGGPGSIGELADGVARDMRGLLGMLSPMFYITGMLMLVSAMFSFKRAAEDGDDEAFVRCLPKVLSGGMFMFMPSMMGTVMETILPPQPGVERSVADGGGAGEGKVGGGERDGKGSSKP